MNPIHLAIQMGKKADRMRESITRRLERRIRYWEEIAASKEYDPTADARIEELKLIQYWLTGRSPVHDLVGPVIG